jgi:NitT/TauT family transport system permease protein/sulfonate transport system permease protein
MRSADPSIKAERPTVSWRSRAAERLCADGLVALALVGWWAMSRHLPPYLFPGVADVFRAIVQLLIRPEFAVNTFISIGRIFLSVALALMIGGVLALAPRYVPILHDFIHERLKPLLNSFPSLGWALIGSIWFGVSSSAVIFIQVAILVPFALINISEGLREISVEEQEMARSFSRSRLRVFKLVIFPMLFPYLVAALRITYGVAWKVSLVSELFGANRGLGYLLMDAETKGRIDLVFAICFVIVVFYILGERLIVDPLSRLYRPPSP